VWLERRKWPDSPHYSSQGYVLGADGVGVWLGTRPGNEVYRGDKVSHVGAHAVVWCVPHDDWFLAHFLLGHPEVDIYVDVAAPATWSDRGARMVDLDFDVIVWNDGRPVELVDEDEFEQHRIELAYPPQLVDDARRAASDIFRRVRAVEPPFDQESLAPWRDMLDDLPQ
jgi:protein associated with RNAse G/E